MKRTFVAFPVVTRLFQNLGVPDEAIREMEREIMQEAGDMVKGTGGLRKIRCVAFAKGKSGGVRVIYADYPEIGLCLLVVAFAKNVTGNLSRAEQNTLRKVKSALDKQVKGRAGMRS
jgi:hypothetical protein